MIKIYIQLTNKMKAKCIEGWLCTEKKKRLWICVLLFFPGPRFFELCCLLEQKELRSSAGEQWAFAAPRGRDSCLLCLPAYYLLLQEDLCCS